MCFWVARSPSGELKTFAREFSQSRLIRECRNLVSHLIVDFPGEDVSSFDPALTEVRSFIRVSRCLASWSECHTFLCDKMGMESVFPEVNHKEQNAQQGYK